VKQRLVVRPSQGSNAVIWEFAVGDSWSAFHRKDIPFIEQAYENWEQAPNPQDGGSTMQMEVNGKVHELNFSSMMQTPHESHQPFMCAQCCKATSQARWLVL
tara:strand:+ start:367 stop:672 length:306 start_codon:yes stop_codon:yes gene_type:complete